MKPTTNAASEKSVRMRAVQELVASNHNGKGKTYEERRNWNTRDKEGRLATNSTTVAEDGQEVGGGIEAGQHPGALSETFESTIGPLQKSRLLRA